MKLSLTAFISFLPILASAGAIQGCAPKPCCLTDADTDAIIKRYNAAFDTSGPSEDPVALKKVVDETFTDDVIIYSETFNGGVSDVASTNKTAIYDTQVALMGLDGPTKGERFKTVYSFHTCNQIAYRWELDNIVAEGNEIFKGVHVPLNKTGHPPGSKIQYKGLDILVVNCETKLIHTIYSSADIQNFFSDIGYNPCLPPTA